ncbi:MAG: LptF/LptG family permease [Bacteroidota bacterium]|jgi:lipopolysaccharide export system permease protein
MKKIDRLLLRSFVGPFILIFFITLFVLVMQFLWKYIDELVGKGLSLSIIGELLFLASASLVPLALPLAMLLSSMMTIGNYSEQFELTALKSSGASLFRILRSMFFASMVISLGALLFSNYVLPIANLKFGALLYDVRQQRPALNIKPGVFNNDISGISIRVGAKDADNQTIHDVLIYDHTSNRGQGSVLFARKGVMTTTADKRYLMLELFDGNQYEESTTVKANNKKNEQIRFHFERWVKAIDLSEFNMTRTKESLFKDNYQMMNISQLNAAIDTINMNIARSYSQLDDYLQPYFTFMTDTTMLAQAKSTNPGVLHTDTLTGRNKLQVYHRALGNIRNVKGYCSIIANDVNIRTDLITRHRIEWHRKFTLSLACIILFFIGAPLGAIIRKGGFGLPFVVSILFFVVYYMVSISGEKFAKEHVLTAFQGMWLSVLILFPLGIFLTYKASHDSAIMNIDAFRVLISRWMSRIRRKRNAS